MDLQSEKILGRYKSKVVYNKNTSDGKIKEDLAKCKNSDNLFIAIHSGFQNAGHLLNSMIAENCDIRRNVLSTQPRSDDPYFTAVCEINTKHFSSMSF